MGKQKDEYVPYGMCPGFDIFVGGGHLLSGHMMIKTSDTKEMIAKKMTKLVTDECRKNNLSEEKTLESINNNLRTNNLL